MTTSAFPSQLANFQEVTQGLGPASGAAWVTAAGTIALGARLRHIAESLAIDGVQQAVVEDERSQTTIFGKSIKVKGLRNVTFPFSIYWTGSGATTAAASQIAATAQSLLLQHALGGTHRSNSTLLTGGGHTTTIINVTSATNLTPGCLIMVEDATDNTIAVRRILSIATLAVTLDEVLPFTPVDGDTVRGMLTSYIVESTLSDSSVGPTTMSWLVQKGLAAALENWEFNGCKSELKSIDLSRGGLPVLKFETQAASFDPPQTAPSPTWAGATIHGNAPVAIGPDSIWTYQTYGTTTINAIHVTESSIDVGVPVVRVETNTEVDADMEGTQCYTTQPADTMISLGVVPMASAPWTDFAADTYKRLRFYKRAGNGQIICVHFSRCEIVEQPKRTVAGAASSIGLSLRAHPDLDNASASNADLWTSKILIGIG